MNNGTILNNGTVNNGTMKMTYMKNRNAAGERLYRFTIDDTEYKGVTMDEAAKIIAEREENKFGKTT